MIRNLNNINNDEDNFIEEETKKPKAKKRSFNPKKEGVESEESQGEEKSKITYENLRLGSIDSILNSQKRFLRLYINDGIDKSKFELISKVLDNLVKGHKLRTDTRMLEKNNEMDLMLKCMEEAIEEELGKEYLKGLYDKIAKIIKTEHKKKYGRE